MLDAPAGLQNFKLRLPTRGGRQGDHARPVPSVFDIAATEDFLNSIRNRMRNVVGIVTMRVDPYRCCGDAGRTASFRHPHPGLLQRRTM